MFTSVRGTLAGHEDKNTWTEIPGIVKAVDDLDIVIEGVATQLEATAVFSGAVAAKLRAQEALAVAGHEIAAAIHACATAAGDEELAAEVDFSLSDLSKGHPVSIIALCTRIGAIASEELAMLADYNITQAKLTALTRKIEAFEKVCSKPRQNVAKKVAANRALPRLFKQACNILTRRLDRLMVQFRTSAPEFYAEYKSARKIVNPPTSQNGEANNIVSANTNGAEVLKAA
jgi:hypothetical protein